MSERTPSSPPQRPPFLPALEGLRAVASIGIVATHVAFQTGNDTGNLVNRMLARTDFFVPVFFALSGFLLWRSHCRDFNDVRTGPGRHRWATYYVKRLGRIMPAYLVLVVLVLALFPVAKDPGTVPVLANLLLLQNYVADGLVGGLTHLWSLCVEMFFYLVLPLLAVAVGRRSRRTRVTVIVAVGAFSALWPFLVGERSGDLNPHIMPWAFFGSFGVGLLAAEAEGWLSQAAPDRVRRIRRWAGRRALWILLAVAMVGIAASDGPEGLAAASPGEFARRTTYGVIFAAALVVPLALRPESRVLGHPVMQALGRWSYSVFLWHMAVLSLVFPLLGIGLFRSGYLVALVVWGVTVAFSVAVAALSYSLVEDPARRAVSRWWSARGRRGADSASGTPAGPRAENTTAVRHTMRAS